MRDGTKAKMRADSRMRSTESRGEESSGPVTNRRRAPARVILECRRRREESRARKSASSPVSVLPARTSTRRLASPFPRAGTRVARRSLSHAGGSPQKRHTQRHRGGADSDHEAAATGPFSCGLHEADESLLVERSSAHATPPKGPLEHPAA